LNAPFLQNFCAQMMGAMYTDQRPNKPKSRVRDSPIMES
jgi:hypothetical protein